MKKLRHMLLLLLAGVLLSSSALAAPLLPAPDPTADPTERRADAIDCMVICGFLRGNGVDLGLDDALTRAEAAVLLVRLCGAEEMAYQAKPAPFTDVPDWAAEAVNYLYAEGAVKGMSADKYGSNAALTARDFTVMLLRRLGYQESAGDFAYADAIAFAHELGLYDAAEYAWLLANTYDRSAACFAAYQMLRATPKGGDQAYAYVITEDIRASYPRVTAEIICGDNAVYNALQEALDALEAEDSYTLTQTAAYSHKGMGTNESAAQTSVYRRDKVRSCSSMDIVLKNSTGTERVRVFLEDSLVLRRADAEPWKVISPLPALLTDRYHHIPEHLFAPTPTLCRSSVLTQTNGLTVITGFDSRVCLLTDITAELTVGYLYDFEILIDPATDRIREVNVSYKDVWDENGARFDVVYKVKYSFSGYGTTDVLTGMDGLEF